MSLPIESQFSTDPKVIAAGIDYNYAVALTEGKSNTTKLYEHTTLDCKLIRKLIDLAGEFSPENEAYLYAVNQYAKISELYLLTDYPKFAKDAAEMFRTYSNIIKIANPTPLTLTHLEILVNSRRFNKRLPKDLSSYIKEILDYNVHSKGKYWDNFPELNTLQGKLRKLWVQCMSLRIYNYNPNTSYTQKLISDIVPSVLQSKDAEVHWLYTRLIHDCKIDSIVIDNYDAILNNLIKQTGDNNSAILQLNAALLLDNLNQDNYGWRNATYDIEVVKRRHPAWIQKAIEYVTLQEKGITIREFCNRNKLPLTEFSRFYSAVVTEVEKKAQSDPFLRKLTSLPKKDQDEYSEIIRRRTKIMQQMCEAISGITGEKVEIKDLFGGNGKSIDRIDKKMNEALDRFNSIDPSLSAKFCLSLYELHEIESEVDAFLTERGL